MKTKIAIVVVVLSAWGITGYMVLSFLFLNYNWITTPGFVGWGLRAIYLIVVFGFGSIVSQQAIDQYNKTKNK